MGGHLGSGGSPDAGAGAGPVIPPAVCVGTASVCGALVVFDPREGQGWWDYPVNGETEANQYRSYARRDLVMLVQYAAATVAERASKWSGNGGRLGLGDMSEADGAIPGTRIGAAGHPQGTHTDGFDIDTAYYQTGTSDNKLRPVCPHIESGTDQSRCIAPPTNLDVPRTAFFIGLLHDSPRLRVVGVDGQVGPLVLQGIATLCQAGQLTNSACSSPKLAYETENTGGGWYRFHHHNMHVSLMH